MGGPLMVKCNDYEDRCVVYLSIPAGPVISFPDSGSIDADACRSMPMPACAGALVSKPLAGGSLLLARCPTLVTIRRTMPESPAGAQAADESLAVSRG